MESAVPLVVFVLLLLLLVCSRGRSFAGWLGLLGFLFGCYFLTIKEGHWNGFANFSAICLFWLGIGLLIDWLQARSRARLRALESQRENAHPANDAAAVKCNH